MRWGLPGLWRNGAARGNYLEDRQRDESQRHRYREEAMHTPTMRRGGSWIPELVEDFEHPICECCMGTGWVRDENGIHMVRCNYCEGKGRAPARE